MGQMTRPTGQIILPMGQIASPAGQTVRPAARIIRPCCVMTGERFAEAPESAAVSRQPGEIEGMQDGVRSPSLAIAEPSSAGAPVTVH
jgi:hypothetical protein